MADISSIVRSYYDLVDDNAFEELFELFTEDIVYHRPGQEAIRGMDAFREFYEHDRPLEDGEHFVHDIIVEDDKAAVRGTFKGVQAGTSVEFDFADFHFLNEKYEIYERFTYTDRDTI